MWSCPQQVARYTCSLDTEFEVHISFILIEASVLPSFFLSLFFELNNSVGVQESCSYYHLILKSHCWYTYI